MKEPTMRRKIYRSKLDSTPEQAQDRVSGRSTGGQHVANTVRNRHLATNISDAGRGQFRTILTCKAEQAGQVLREVVGIPTALNREALPFRDGEHIIDADLETTMGKWHSVLQRQRITTINSLAYILLPTGHNT